MIDRAEGDTDRGIGAMTNRNQMKGRERPQREDISKYIISFALPCVQTSWVGIYPPKGTVARIVPRDGTAALGSI